MYRLIFDRKVEKFLRKQDKAVRIQIRDALVELAENPYKATHVKRLRASKKQFRKRVGNYRIIFEIVDEKLVILILKISSRGSAYKES